MLLVRLGGRAILASALIILCASLLAGSLDLFTVPYGIFILLTAVFIWLLRRRLNRRSSGLARILHYAGFAFAAAVILLSWLGVYFRLPKPTPFLLSLTYIAYVGCTFIWLLKLARERPAPRRLRFTLGLIGIPFVSGWIFASMLHLSLSTIEGILYGSVPISLQAPSALRAGHGTAYPGVTVIAALSGGGYRAAAVHAGVLRELENQGVPIHYLSTVSGGSIIGAFCSLGHSPEDFQKMLVKRKLWGSIKPGLANDLFNFRYLFRELVYSGWRNSDTYARHLSHHFFGEARLREAGEYGPVPLINVTERATRSRWVFAPGFDSCGGTGRPGGSCSFDDAPLSELVAASGAFPGAFEPKVLGGREFVDGGVVENLGLLGVRDYFMDAAERPNILLISDVGKTSEHAGAAGVASAGRPRLPKHFVVSQLGDALDIVMAAGARELFRVFTGEKYDGHRLTCLLNQPFKAHYHDIFKHDDEGCLYTYVFRPTVQEELDHLLRLPGTWTYTIGGETESLLPADISELPQIDTLQELDRRQVYAAGWAGQMTVRRYFDELKRTRGNAIKPFASCGASQRAPLAPGEQGYITGN